MMDTIETDVLSDESAQHILNKQMYISHTDTIPVWKDFDASCKLLQ